MSLYHLAGYMNDLNRDHTLIGDKWQANGSSKILTALNAHVTIPPIKNIMTENWNSNEQSGF